MRIDGWVIDGFGVFRDHRQRGLADGLTVFVGPNEAGKSTLLAFLRYVLVGYRGRKLSDHYRPLAGGEHGGRVFLHGESGEVSVERMVGRPVPRVLTGSDGRATQVEEGDGAVRRLLGGVDIGLFNSVFAFSLAELQDLRSLAQDDVRDRVFSAGIAGAGRSARQVATRLEKDSLLLIKPRKGARANELLESLAEVEKRLCAARAASERYPALVREEEEAEARRALLQQEESALRDLGWRYQLLKELWPTHVELTQAEAEMDGPPVFDAFPVDPEVRLAAALGGVKAAEDRAADLQQEVDSALKAASDLEVLLRDDLASVAPRVAEAAERSGLYESWTASLPKARAALDSVQESLERTLLDLGPTWDEERLADFDVSLAWQEEVRAWGRRLREADTALDECTRAHSAALAALDDGNERLARARARTLGPEPVDEGQLRLEEAAIKRLRVDVQELGVAQVGLDGLAALAADRERALHAAEQGSGGAGRALPAMVFLALALACFAGALVAGLLVDPMWGIVGGLGGLVFALVAYDSFGRPLAGAQRRARAGEVDSLRASLKSAQAERSRREEEHLRVLARVGLDAAALGLTSPPSIAGVEEREEGVRRLRAELEEWARFEERVVEVEDEVARTQAVLEKQAALLDEARTASEGVHRQWSEWRGALGVPETLSPEAVGEFVRVVREAKATVARRDDSRSKVAELEEAIASWEGEARAVLAECVDEATTGAGAGADLAARMRQLLQACAHDGAERTRLADLRNRLGEATMRLDAAAATTKRARDERNALFQEAGVADEAAFRERTAIVQQRAALEARRSEARRILDSRLGQGLEAEHLREELATGRVGHWSQEAERVEREIQKIENDVREAIRVHRDVERDRQELEKSSDVAALELEAGGIRAEFAATLRQWLVTAAARRLVEETLADYSRSRQPPVLAEASLGFARVTGGAYTQIIERDDEEGFAVVDDCGGLKLPEDLSRGTLEQLYLTLRLGLAGEFARRASSVPVIMDDVLVNFDPRRARATAEVLVDFARGHQVLFFTCHPSTAQLFRSVDADIPVVELMRGVDRQATLWEG
ncbi:MAG: AAA family ATPase [Actinobacteria bacterium]|nr:AAA family ATPase [Actinomycetota bacterium]